RLFLATARELVPRAYPILLTIAHTGLRIGEALGLQRADVDLETRTLTIARTAGPTGRAGPTKSGRRRLVDLTDECCAILRPHAGAAGHHESSERRREADRGRRPRAPPLAARNRPVGVRAGAAIRGQPIHGGRHSPRAKVAARDDGAAMTPADHWRFRIGTRL